MKFVNFYISACLAILTLGSCAFSRQGKNSSGQDKKAVLKIINKVNSRWQEQHPQPGNAFWDEAAYQTGNMEAYFVTGNEDFRNYAEKWAEKNNWKGAASTDKTKWKYHYGETPEHVLFGDWQICFQTYIDLYLLDSTKKEFKIARAKEVMDYQMSTLRNDYWWWADGLYMVMPVMTKMYRLTGNMQYLDKLNEYFAFADSLMFDKEAHLYYRDGKYLFPKHKSANGKRDFWARGDGWVFAGLAKVLADMPENYRHYDFFLQRYRQMAEALADAQQTEGYWTRSILDPAHAPGPETSGTAFISYGYLWGMNNGLLNEKKYGPVVKKSWKYLSQFALQENGDVGYIQPIGEKAIPGQVVNQRSTSNFGVGAFLLAASEMYRRMKK